MTLNFLDRIIYPEISINGIEKFHNSMKLSHTYSNFGPISIKLQETIHDYLSLPENFCVFSTVSGHIGIDVFGYLLKRLNKTKHIAIADIGFAGQWHFIDQFFDQITILPTNHKYYLDADEVKKLLKDKTCDAIYITATYGQDISKEIKKLRKYFPDTFIIADYANALFTANMVYDENIFYMASLHATKLFGIGEGGLILCHNKWHNLVKKIMNFGINQNREIESTGTNAKMSEFSAAIALINLPMVEERKKKLQTLKSFYKKYLNTKNIKIYGETSIMLQFLDEDYKKHTLSQLLSKNIATHTMYLPHIPEWTLNSKKVEILGDYLPLRSISLGVPFHPLLSEKHIKYITSLI